MIRISFSTYSFYDIKYYFSLRILIKTFFMKCLGSIDLIIIFWFSFVHGCKGALPYEFGNVIKYLIVKHVQLMSQVVKPIHCLKIKVIELVRVCVIPLQSEFVNLGMELVSPHLFMCLLVGCFCSNAKSQGSKGNSINFLFLVILRCLTLILYICSSLASINITLWWLVNFVNSVL